MCGIRSLIIAVLLGIVVCPVAGPAASGGPSIGDLCAQLDPSSRLEGLEYFPLRESKVQREYREPVGLEAVREALPGFLSDLDQRDPVMRIEAVARFAKARSWIPPGNGAAELDQWLIDRLRHESQSQVVEAIIRVLGEHTDTPGLAPILIELIQCDRDPELRSTALEVANSVSDPALLEPLIGAWRNDTARVDRASALRALARLKDRRSLEVAMEGLQQEFLEAVPLMRAVGTQMSQVIDAISSKNHKYPISAKWRKRERCRRTIGSSTSGRPRRGKWTKCPKREPYARIESNHRAASRTRRQADRASTARGCLCIRHPATSSSRNR
jgi:hypothetical protein